MKRSFHVYKNNKISASFNTFEQAVANAKALHKTGSDNDKLEVTHMGLLVWGPYVVGGKNNPI